MDDDPKGRSKAVAEDLWTLGAGHAMGAMELAKVARAQPPSHGLHDADAMAFNGGLSPSLHLLMGYSFELLLKAAYVACGGKEKDLRAIGHDLLSCLNRAEKAGFRSEIPELRWIIEQLRKPHLGHQFRYGQNDVVSLPPLATSMPALDKLTKEVGVRVFGLIAA